MLIVRIGLFGPGYGADGTGQVEEMLALGNDIGMRGVTNIDSLNNTLDEGHQ